MSLFCFFFTYINVIFLRFLLLPFQGTLTSFFLYLLKCFFCKACLLSFSTPYPIKRTACSLRLNIYPDVILFNSLVIIKNNNNGLGYRYTTSFVRYTLYCTVQPRGNLFTDLKILQKMGNFQSNFNSMLDNVCTVYWKKPVFSFA